MNDKIAELLEKLAAKLGVTVDHLWAVLVKQVHNQMIAEIIGYVFVLAVTVMLIMIYRHYTKRAADQQDNWDWDEHVGLGIGLGCGVFLAGVGWIAMICSISDFLAMINNPEYVALKNVLGIIAGE